MHSCCIHKDTTHLHSEIVEWNTLPQLSLERRWGLERRYLSCLIRGERENNAIGCPSDNMKSMIENNNIVPGVVVVSRIGGDSYKDTIDRFIFVDGKGNIGMYTNGEYYFMSKNYDFEAALQRVRLDEILPWCHRLIPWVEYMANKYNHPEVDDESEEIRSSTLKTLSITTSDETAEVLKPAVKWSVRESSPLLYSENCLRNRYVRSSKIV